MYLVAYGSSLDQVGCLTRTAEDSAYLFDAIQGVDRSATLAALNSKIDAHDAGMLRGILCGSVRLQKRLHEAGLVEDPLCPFCGIVDESVEHCFWECPCWDAVRSQFELPSASVVSQWPKCTKACGLFFRIKHTTIL